MERSDGRNGTAVQWQKSFPNKLVLVVRFVYHNIFIDNESNNIFHSPSGWYADADPPQVAYLERLIYGAPKSGSSTYGMSSCWAIS